MEIQTLISTSNPEQSMIGPIGIFPNETDSVFLPGILGADVYNGLTILIARVILPLTEIFGSITNIVNLLVFWSIGLNDSVTSSFFVLSISDLLYLLLSFIGWTSSLLGEFQFQNWLHLKDLSKVSIWYSHVFSAMSVFFTAYIAVQRCCCVVLPLRFKGVFTAKRNIFIIVILCFTSIVLHAPILSKMALKPVFEVSTNTSKLRIWYADDWNSLVTVKDFLVGLWMPISTQVLTVICMFILISGLRESSRFRQYAATNQKETKGSSNRKELQVVQAVIVVTLLSIISNTVPICQAIVRRLVPGFGLFKRYNNMFFIMVITKHAFQHFNASFNMFVYLKFNTTFRNIFKKVILKGLKC